MAPDLDSELRDLGAAIELPPTPDLARAVRARLEPAPRRPRRRALRALALATLAVLVPAATVLAASPAARDAVLDWLGLGGAKVERVPRLPRLPPGARIDLGPQVALRTARERAPFGVLVPALLGTPDAVHLHAGTAAGPVVSLVYRPGPRLPPTPETGVGLLVREWRGQVERERVQKLVVGGAERVRVGRARGLWLSGGPHVVLFRTRDGNVVEQPGRLAGNTLLLARGDRLVRLESSLPRREALAVAASMR